MNASLFSHRLRAAAVAAGCLTLACAASAVRIGGGAAPVASSVEAGPQQPTHVQADETASLRQGTITAVDASGGRVKIQEIWLDVLADKTKLIRNGRPAGLDTLKVGESIRFTVAPGRAAAQSLGVIYAP